MFFKEKEKSAQVTDAWVDREIELAIEKEASNKTEENNWIKLCYESAKEAYSILLGKGHSGMSMSLTKTILNRLIDRKPLTNITEDDFKGVEISWVDNQGTSYTQCPRYCALFKVVDKDGKVSYSDNNRVSTIDRNGFECFCGPITKMIDKRFPLTLPYFPWETFKVYTAEFTYDKETDSVSIDPGIYNATYISHILTPENKTISLDTFTFEDPEVKVNPKTLKSKLKKELISNGLSPAIIKS